MHSPRLSLAFAPLLFLAAPSPDDDPRRSDAAARAVDAREAAVAAEAAGDGAPWWAGAYYRGDGLGVNVTLAVAPGAGFAFEWHGCLGLYDRNLGAVRVVDAAEGIRVRLEPEWPNAREGFRGIETELVPVRWGERAYLLPPGELDDFAHDVNAGYEPRERLHGAYLLRRGDAERRAAGRPELPEPYASWILREPLAATALEVEAGEDPAADERYRGPVELVVDRGAEHGVVVGMRFFLPSGWSGRAVAVEPGTTRVRFDRLLARDPLPTVGTELRTRR